MCSRTQCNTACVRPAHLYLYTYAMCEVLVHNGGGTSCKDYSAAVCDVLHSSINSWLCKKLQRCSTVPSLEVLFEILYLLSNARMSSHLLKRSSLKKNSRRGFLDACCSGCFSCAGNAYSALFVIFFLGYISDGARLHLKDRVPQRGLQQRRREPRFFRWLNGFSQGTRIFLRPNGFSPVGAPKHVYSCVA